MAWDRKERLEALIKEKVAVIVLERLSDPRLGFVTITGVQLSRDKRHAKVLYTVLGTANQRRTTDRALQDASRHVQEQLAPTLRLRMMPELRFTYDESIDKESRMLDLLQDIAAQRRAAGGDMSLADADAAAALAAGLDDAETLAAGPHEAGTAAAEAGEGPAAAKGREGAESGAADASLGMEGLSSRTRQSAARESSSAADLPVDDAPLIPSPDPQTDADDPHGTPGEGDPRDHGRDAPRRSP